MKFLCDSCGTKYSISDDRVRGRVLKIRCKKCDFVITVREDAQAAAAASELPPPADDSSSFDQGDGANSTMVGGLPPTVPAKIADADDWYLSFDGEQEGPLSLAKAIERVRMEASSEKEAHAWRPSFLVWLPVEEVPELEPARAAAMPVRASMPTPIPGTLPRPSQISRDPSGPRAALSVSAGAPSAAMPAAASPAGGSRAGAPPLPGSTSGTKIPVQKPAPAELFSNGPTQSVVPEEPAPPMFGGASAPTSDDLEDDPDDHDASSNEDAPDLPISNEASGLVNMAHLAASAFGKPTGQAFINGHTGRVQKLPSQRVSALEPAEGPVHAAPVVMLGASAQASPIFKYISLVALLVVVALGVVVVILLRRGPERETIVVTRTIDQTPITMTDPNVPAVAANEPKKTGAVAAVKRFFTGKPATPPPGKPDTMSGSQKALADLYKDDGERAVAGTTAQAGSHGPAGEVSQQAFMAVVAQNRRGLNLCLDRALKRDNSLKSGRIMTQVSVGISGRVTGVVLPEAQYASSELGQCFVQTIKRWNFPASNGPYTMEFPFILQGQ